MKTWALIVTLLFAVACGTGTDDTNDTNNDTNNQTETEETTYTVDHYRMSCVGEGAQLCLRVREEGEENYTLFYSSIEGFEFQWGRQYSLRVAVAEVDDPPMDGSSRSYELVEVLSEDLVDPGTNFDFLVMHIGAGYTPYLSVDGESGNLMDGRAFRCQELSDCEEIEQLLLSEEDFTVTFEYDTDIDDPLIVVAVEE